MTTRSASVPCRSCGYEPLHAVLDLGSTPLANSLLSENQLSSTESTYPLEVTFCSKCTLVQITETVPPDEMFRDYAYLSSYSDTMLHHAEAIANRLSSSRNLDEGSLVVEIASNDGYLLQYYKKLHVPVLGVEPALNVARIAEQERGIPTISEFFGAELARDLRKRGQAADVIHANNVLAHVPDLNGFLAGIEILLKPTGIACIEFPYVKELVDRLEFDTIYHEHLCYFSLTAVDHLVRRQNLVIIGVEPLAIHGGSLRVYVARNDGAEMARESSWMAPEDLLEEERLWGVNTFEFYMDFSRRVEQLRADLKSLLRNLREEGKSIAAYGAAAKGSTLLNYCQLGRSDLDFVADLSPVKQGHYLPGARIPICSPSRLLERSPDYVVLLAWNLENEILSQQEEFRRRGGKFIIPIPQLRIV